MRRSPRGCFECGDTTHFITDCPKRMKLDSSNKYDYTKRNDYNKGDDKKKYRFRDKKKKKKFQKMISRACTALSDLNFSSDDSSSSEEDIGPSSRQVTSSAFASWASRHGTSLTLNPM
jgi:hypothetical protein